MIKFDFSKDTYEPKPIAQNSENHQVADAASQVSPLLGPMAYTLGRHLVLPLFFGRITITGQDNIPTTGPIILAPTHRARWDALLVPYATSLITGNDLRFMVTITECQGLQGWFVRHLGGFPVDTQHPTISTLRHGVSLLQQRKTLVIFPEGGIFRDGKVHTLKTGIARLSLSAETNHPGLGVKIVPMSINYSQPYPNWGTDVNINIGNPINVAEFTNGSIKQNAKRLTEELAKELQHLNHQESEVTNGQWSMVNGQ
ncbi:1-acyl-sn-glycerol-3-phosphate acyltransferase [Nostoc sp. LEGE 06077]|uniref:lysophospholipid acyltransferase family protein n=1 Tax=Nostoc sp. LEGE 06077 TaxID=915325 RepID=UPI0018801FDC|nr:1-acyl-sn-glycerol-3-phosphate acyltransferase [Nostoc sp. LEGE 06077]MBE9210100.1 1-acyl-sn-glycerol-3-phosphate acyltransferase [Nostoc sp. LEGE 06077]